MYIMEKNLATCDLPVRAALPDLFRALRETGTAVLSAAPGAGKPEEIRSIDALRSEHAMLMSEF